MDTRGALEKATFVKSSNRSGYCSKYLAVTKEAFSTIAFIIGTNNARAFGKEGAVATP